MSIAATALTRRERSQHRWALAVGIALLINAVVVLVLAWLGRQVVDVPALPATAPLVAMPAPSAPSQVAPSARIALVGIPSQDGRPGPLLPLPEPQLPVGDVVLPGLDLPHGSPALPMTTANAPGDRPARYRDALDLARFYPPRAQHRRIEGRVTVQVHIAQDGTVGEVRIVSAEPAGTFDNASLDLVHSLHWQAAERDGHPTSSDTQLIIAWKLP